MHSEIEVKLLKSGTQVAFYDKQAAVEAHPGFSEWLSNNIPNMVDAVAKGIGAYFTGGALAGEAIKSGVNLLNAVLSESSTQNMAINTLHLSFGPDYDLIYVVFKAWSEDELKPGTCQTISVPPEAKLFHTELKEKSYVVGYFLETSGLASNTYPFIFGAQDDGWHYDSAVVSEVDIQFTSNIQTAVKKVSSLGIASRGPAHVEVFYVGQDQGLWHRWSDNGGRDWSDEHNLGGVLISAPAAISPRENLLSAFYVGQNSHLWQRMCDENYNWLDERDLECVLTSAPSVASRGPDHMEVFYRGQDMGLCHRWSDNRGRDWSDEHNLGGVLISAPAAIFDKFGILNAFYVGQNSHLWQRMCDEDYNWLDERDLGGIINTGIPYA